MKCPNCRTGGPLVYKRLFVGCIQRANLFCSSCFLAYQGDGIVKATSETWQIREVGMLFNIDLTRGLDQMVYKLALLQDTE